MSCFRAFFLGIIFSFTLSSCRTSFIIKDVERSLPQIRKTIVSEIGKPRTISKTGKDLTSNYYDKKGEPIENIDSVKERFFTAIEIRGDRRPYSIFVDVFREIKNQKGDFQIVDKDDERSQKIFKKINKSLMDSRIDEGNVVDELRPY